MTRKKCPYCTFDSKTHTVIEYCPKCGRNLRDEKERAVKP